MSALSWRDRESTTTIAPRLVLLFVIWPSKPCSSPVVLVAAFVVCLARRTRAQAYSIISSDIVVFNPERALTKQLRQSVCERCPTKYSGPPAMTPRSLSQHYSCHASPQSTDQAETAQALQPFLIPNLILVQAIFAWWNIPLGANYSTLIVSVISACQARTEHPYFD